MELELTQEDRARITDSTHQIQAADETLTHVDPRKIPRFNEIRKCLRNADQTLRGVLRSIGKRINKPERDRSA
jgi:hypothetical protein